MDFEIGIMVRDDMPKQPVLDLERDLKRLNLRVIVEERENVPFAVIEWAIPAAIIVLITKAYFDGFIKEIGKDHYLFLKKHVGDFAKKVVSMKQKSIASSQSPNKISENNHVSKSFAIWAQTLDGKHLRFLFLNDKSDEFYNYCSDKIFDILLNHAQEFPNDRISNQINKLTRSPHEVYFLFDEAAMDWKIVDIQTEKFLEK